jgi:hypothetical protein
MRKGWLPLFLLVLGTLMASSKYPRRAAPQTPASIGPTPLPLLSKTGHECDNGKRTTGGLDLTQYKTRAADADSKYAVGGYGFETAGAVASLSVVQMEVYPKPAETITRAVGYGAKNAKPTTMRRQPPGRRRRGDFDDLLLTAHPRLSVTNNNESSLSVADSLHAAPDNGTRPAGSEPLYVAALIYGQDPSAALRVAQTGGGAISLWTVRRQHARVSRPHQLDTFREAKCGGRRY